MYLYAFFFLFLPPSKTEIVAQLVRASDCDSEGRGFETHRSPKKILNLVATVTGFFYLEK